MKSNQSGFSLIELMIVVGIIGVIVTMSSNQMRGFLIKAERAEAIANARTIEAHLYLTLQDTNALPNKQADGTGTRLCNDEVADPTCLDMDLRINYDEARHEYYLGTELGPQGWAYALYILSKRDWGMASVDPISLSNTAYAGMIVHSPGTKDAIRISGGAPGVMCRPNDAISNAWNQCPANGTAFGSVELPTDYVKP